MPSPSPLQADLAAALDWWREAGVDAVFEDEPRGWLAEPAAEAEAAAPPSRKPLQPAPAPPPDLPKIGGPREQWPRDLAAFRAWWLSEASLDEGGLAPRIAPSGDAGAKLMVLVAMPEEGDRDTLLSGPGGAVRRCVG